MSGARNKRTHSSADLTSARGHSCVLATCDASREREASKELVNLLQQAMEARYPKNSTGDAIGETNSTNKTLCEMLQEELQDLKQSSRHRDQPLVSVSTGTKGVVLVIIKDVAVCGKQLFYEIYDRIIRDKQSCCRHIVRLIPFQRVFYPDYEDLKSNLEELIQQELSNSSEPPLKRQGVEIASSDPLPHQALIPWCVEFKARNHDTLKKREVYDMVNSVMPPGYRVDYKQPEVTHLFHHRVLNAFSFFNDERTSAVF